MSFAVNLILRNGEAVTTVICSAPPTKGDIILLSFARQLSQEDDQPGTYNKDFIEKWRRLDGKVFEVLQIVHVCAHSFDGKLLARVVETSYS